MFDANLGITTPPSLSSCSGSGAPLKTVSRSDSCQALLSCCELSPPFLKDADAGEQITFLLQHFLTGRNWANLVGEKQSKFGRWEKYRRSGQIGRGRDEKKKELCTIRKGSRACAAKLLKILQRICLQWNNSTTKVSSPQILTAS